MLRRVRGKLSQRTRIWHCVHCHKGLGSPKGTGFLYARREVQHLLEPLVVSWGWNREEPDPKGLENPSGLSRFVDEQEWQGTRDPAAYLSVPAAIPFQADHDCPRVRAECYELLREVRRRIEEYGRSMLRPYEPICPDSPEWYLQKAALPLPPCDGTVLQQRLYEE